MKFAFGLIAVLCVLGARADDETPASAAPEASEPQVSTLEVKDKICEPGVLSEVACNTCICNNDGTELACTKKICVPGMEGDVTPQNLPATEEEVKPQNLPVPEADLEAKPENLPATDAAEIPAVAKDRRRRRRDSDDDVCEPGKNFKKECNDCECPASGKRSEAQICTTIAC